MKGNFANNPHYLNIHMIGESLYLLELYLSRNIYTVTNSNNKKQIKSIFDLWDFNYKYNSDIEFQIEEAFNKYEKNKSNAEINSKEVLIVHAQNKNSEIIKTIFSKMEKIKRLHYMPLVLFLIDDYKNGDKIIPDKNLYPSLNSSLIMTAEYIKEKEYIFESEQKELTEEGNEKMEKIKNILLRFCSYYNDLGDRFSIGSGDKQINYDLTEIYYPFTINICCIGRFGKGKSTCVNCLLGETKARESKSGASTTKNINYYQVNNQPIKVYDIPGFENKETTSNAVKKLIELNNKINELKDQIHIIIYVLKSTDERMFADLEYSMFEQISKQNNSKLLYVLTHSNKDMDKDELVDMINIGIKGVLEKHKKGKNNKNEEIFRVMRANEDNCILVNFHKNENMPIYGIHELFKKLAEISKETESYKKFSKKNLNDYEFDKMVKEEADIRKIKAEKILIYHSIGAGAVGIIPGVDLAVQKLVIQKSAAKKIGQIFGVDINLIPKNKSSDTQDLNIEKNFEILKKNITGEIALNVGKYSSSAVSLGTSAANISASVTSKAGQITGEVGLAALRGVSISFMFIGSAIGIGAGYFFMQKHCKNLINMLYEYFINNIRSLSNSLEQAIQYMEYKANNYDN